MTLSDQKRMTQKAIKKSDKDFQKQRRGQEQLSDGIEKEMTELGNTLLVLKASVKDLKTRTEPVSIEKRKTDDIIENLKIEIDQISVEVKKLKMNYRDNQKSVKKADKIISSEHLKLRDLQEEDPTEIEASRHGLSYIKLDGNIGCMVNGAGLAMATMDIIKLFGETPANFLDVGGGASKEKVSSALKIILSDKNVKGILINIFGGIMRCDVLAAGVVDAAKEMKIHVPLVVRLAGTNVEEGNKILKESKLQIIPASDLSDAAEKIVKEIN